MLAPPYGISSILCPDGVRSGILPRTWPKNNLLAKPDDRYRAGTQGTVYGIANGSVRPVAVGHARSKRTFAESCERPKAVGPRLGTGLAGNPVAKLQLLGSLFVQYSTRKI